ncbi:MAG: GTP cyclohydrolase I FolE2 [Armatimonadetes bacterium]|nr:GTP cyclohydrolase I FolE2 [Armatimonadota bacterium]
MSDTHKPLADIQSTHDTRNISIDRVGVRGVKYPIVVMDRENETQHTIGDFTLTVDLPHQFKGTHMSRFIEVLSAHRHEVSAKRLPEILDALRERLNAEKAHIEVTFPYFIEKLAPVTGMASMMEYLCTFIAEKDGKMDFVMQVQVPITTLCPCSKEIADYGAHNQRGLVTAQVRFRKHIWLEEIIRQIEDAASCELYPLLKRPDEKWVTEKAYDTPRFVEDVVREVALRFNAEERIKWYRIEVENFESIHAHNAYACLERTK